MTIPKIASYAMPTPSEVPRSKVSWHPDPERAVLLVHDMQDYFVGFYEREASPIPQLLANLGALRKFAERHGIPVVFSAQPGEAGRARRGLLNDVWGPGLIARPERAGIVAELAPGSRDRVLEKTRYSAFFGTELRALMQAQRRDQLWIGGVFAHIGCMMTACDAFMHDLQAFFVVDALADFSRAHHEQALRFVADCCGRLTWTEELLTSPRASDATASLVRQELARLLALAPEALQGPDDLRAIGLDSVRLMEFAEAMNARGYTLGAVDLMECNTFAELSERARARSPEAMEAP